MELTGEGPTEPRATEIPPAPQVWPEQRPHGTDGFAIASLVLGLVGGVLLSVIFGVIALTRVSKSGKHGKGLACTGLALSACWMVVITAGLAVVASRDAKAHSARTADSGLVHGLELADGDCFTDPPAVTNGALLVRPVSCAGSHDGEVFGHVSAPAGAYPGKELLQKLGSRACLDRSARYLREDRDYPHLAVHYFYPLPSSWAQGTRHITCIYRSGKGQLTGPARDSGVPLPGGRPRRQPD